MDLPTLKTARSIKVFIFFFLSSTVSHKFLHLSLPGLIVPTKELEKIPRLAGYVERPLNSQAFEKNKLHWGDDELRGMWKSSPSKCIVEGRGWCAAMLISQELRHSELQTSDRILGSEWFLNTKVEVIAPYELNVKMNWLLIFDFLPPDCSLGTCIHAEKRVLSSIATLALPKSWLAHRMGNQWLSVHYSIPRSDEWEVDRVEQEINIVKTLPQHPHTLNNPPPADVS